MRNLVIHDSYLSGFFTDLPTTQWRQRVGLPFAEEGEDDQPDDDAVTDAPDAALNAEGWM